MYTSSDTEKREPESRRRTRTAGEARSVKGGKPTEPLRTCRDKTKEGNRYTSMCALSVIAWKCSVPQDELEGDLLSLLPDYNKGATRQIKEKEVYSAIKMYNSKAMLTQRDRLEDWQGWEYKPIQRNHLKQKQHLYLARRRKEDMKAIDLPMKAPEGRPEKSKIVEEWQRNHPDGRKADCIRETGLSKPTVYKWWK